MVWGNSVSAYVSQASRQPTVFVLSFYLRRRLGRGERYPITEAIRRWDTHFGIEVLNTNRC